MQLDSEVFASCVKLRACDINEDVKNLKLQRQGSRMEAVVANAFLSTNSTCVEVVGNGFAWRESEDHSFCLSNRRESYV